MNLFDLFSFFGVIGEVFKTVNTIVTFFKMKYGEKWSEEIIKWAVDLRDGFALLQKENSTTEEKENAAQKITDSFKYLRK